MKVKCRHCGTYIEKSEAYKDETRRGFYYCNEKEYIVEEKKREDAKKEKEAAAERKAKRDAVYHELCDIFCYEVQNSVLFTEWILWNKLANDEKILAYLQENKDYIKSKMERTNGTEYARIRYLSAILKNSLKDYVVTVRAEPEKINVDCEIYEPTVFTKKKRRGLSELEDEVS